jgi:hypothetical protein
VVSPTKPGLLVACAAALVAAAPAAEAHARPYMGLYDCTGYAAGDRDALVPGSSIVVKSGGRYQFGSSRNGKRLNDPVPGRYRLQGRKIVFRSGAFKRAGLSGVWNPPGSPSAPKGFIALKNRQGFYANLACYPALGN